MSRVVHVSRGFTSLKLYSSLTSHVLTPLPSLPLLSFLLLLLPLLPPLPPPPPPPPSSPLFPGLMRKEHPGVALSVKTHHAIRSVLNHCRDTIKQLMGAGMLDETDAERLFRVRYPFT